MVATCAVYENDGVAGVWAAVQGVEKWVVVYDYCGHTGSLPYFLGVYRRMVAFVTIRSIKTLRVV